MLQEKQYIHVLNSLLILMFLHFQNQDYFLNVLLYLLQRLFTKKYFYDHQQLFQIEYPFVYLLHEFYISKKSPSFLIV